MKVLQDEMKFLQTELTEVPSSWTDSDYINFSSDIEAVVPIAFLGVCCFTILSYLVASRKTQDSVCTKEGKWLHPQALPCQSCRFYTHNPYLRCAVHPMTVMTEEAIDCSDYQV
ncbi:hypothetical protein C7B61_04940 [filamentous cyanobacterium CCP1]|nr:hypothetical protein C7B61_04940 [filamentous cyanobacterium CCP1]